MIRSWQKGFNLPHELAEKRIPMNKQSLAVTERTTQTDTEKQQQELRDTMNRRSSWRPSFRATICLPTALLLALSIIPSSHMVLVLQQWKKASALASVCQHDSQAQLLSLSDRKNNFYENPDPLIPWSLTFWLCYTTFQPPKLLSIHKEKSV